MPMTLVDRERRHALTLLLVAAGTDVRGQRFTEITHARDVSASGVGFESAHNLLVGTRLTLKIFIPKALRHRWHDRRTYSIRALVSRVERVPNTARYRIGVRMLEELERPGSSKHV
jgi:PilZ domain